MRFCHGGYRYRILCIWPAAGVGPRLRLPSDFLASIWLRLFAGAASTASVREPYRPVVEDRWLPVYSVVVALHREARVVPQLIAALDAIDYPRSKLDIKLVIEHDDHATRRAIEALHLPAIYEIVIAPAGWPRPPRKNSGVCVRPSHGHAEQRFLLRFCEIYENFAATPEGWRAASMPRFVAEGYRRCKV
jgi:cellulose synthase/poly-beta-1,6-N-acetylglucosamine synthase-like glycosyltransferase